MLQGESVLSSGVSIRDHVAAREMVLNQPGSGRAEDLDDVSGEYGDSSFQSEDAEQQAGLRQIFDRCDTNGDGFITKIELIKLARADPAAAQFFGLPSVIRQEDGRDAFERFFQGVDMNDDRKVSWPELKSWFDRKLHEESGSAAAASPRISQEGVEATGGRCGSAHAPFDTRASLTCESLQSGEFQQSGARAHVAAQDGDEFAQSLGSSPRAVTEIAGSTAGRADGPREFELAALVRLSGTPASKETLDQIWKAVQDGAHLPGSNWDESVAGALDAAHGHDWTLCMYLAARCFKEHGAEAPAAPDERCRKTLWLEVAKPIVIELPPGQDSFSVCFHGCKRPQYCGFPEWVPEHMLGVVDWEQGQVWVPGKGHGVLTNGPCGSACRYNPGQKVELSQLQFKKAMHRQVLLTDEQRLNLLDCLDGQADHGIAPGYQTSCMLPGSWFHVLAYPLGRDFTKVLLRPAVKHWTQSQHQNAADAMQWLGETLVSQCAKAGQWAIVCKLLEEGVPCPDPHIAREFEDVCGGGKDVRRQWLRDLASETIQHRRSLLEAAAEAPNQLGEKTVLQRVLEALHLDVTGPLDLRHGRPPFVLAMANAGRWDVVRFLLEEAPEGVLVSPTVLKGSDVLMKAPADVIQLLESSLRAATLREYFCRLHVGELMGDDLLPSGCKVIREGVLEILAFPCPAHPDEVVQMLPSMLRLGVSTSAGPPCIEVDRVDKAMEAELAFVAITEEEFAACVDALAHNCQIMPVNLGGKITTTNDIRLLGRPFFTSVANTLGSLPLHWLAVLCPPGFVEEVATEANNVCPEGHAMQRCLRKKASNNCCDSCRRAGLEPHEPVYRCAACDFEVCHRCFGAEAVGLCPLGHELLRYERKKAWRNSCNGCRRRGFKAPEYTYRCEVCDFDLCQKCSSEVHRGDGGTDSEAKDARLSTLQVPRNCMQAPYVVRNSVIRVKVQTPCCHEPLRDAPVYVSKRCVGKSGGDGVLDLPLPIGKHEVSTTPGGSGTEIWVQQKMVLVDGYFLEASFELKTKGGAKDNHNCEGLYLRDVEFGTLNGKPVYMRDELDRCVVYDGRSWVVAATDDLINFKADPATVKGYHRNAGSYITDSWKAFSISVKREDGPPPEVAVAAGEKVLLCVSEDEATKDFLYMATNAKNENLPDVKRPFVGSAEIPGSSWKKPLDAGLGYVDGLSAVLSVGCDTPCYELLKNIQPCASDGRTLELDEGDGGFRDWLTTHECQVARLYDGLPLKLGKLVGKPRVSCKPEPKMTASSESLPYHHHCREAVANAHSRQSRRPHSQIAIGPLRRSDYPKVSAAPAERVRCPSQTGRGGRGGRCGVHRPSSRPNRAGRAR